MCASDDNVTTLEHLSGEPDLMKNVIYSVYKDTKVTRDCKWFLQKIVVPTKFKNGKMMLQLLNST